MNFYNDNDPAVCAWLLELIAMGEIPPGVVDSRSIADIKPDELRGFTQCHFFCGVGGWVLACRFAGIGPDAPIWTGSCPCQPVSGSGAMRGRDDERHLWPEFYRLIRECRPSIIVGEQVASGLGAQWVDDVGLDLEDIGYAFATADLPAACVGTNHIRQRLWWVAHSSSIGQSKPRIGWQNPRDNPPNGFWETDRLVDAVRRGNLPFLCGLHDGVPVRVARGAGKGYGNSIVPQLGALFLRAVEGTLVK